MVSIGIYFKCRKIKDKNQMHLVCFEGHHSAGLLLQRGDDIAKEIVGNDLLTT